MDLTDTLVDAIRHATGQAFYPDHRQPVGGGCINRTELLEGAGQRYFVKLNDASRLEMFEAESAGLQEIASSGSIRVPKPVVSGSADGQSFLVLEFLDLGRSHRASDVALGRNLANLHRHTASRFGWRRNNTIGATPQINTETQDWVVFFREHRLRFQLDLVARRGARRLHEQGEALLEVLPRYFADYHPTPSLLHGDLWGGNHGALRDGTPVVFDPAVYYGDREADIAMTELFGGFGQEFYSAYNAAWPLDPGFAIRKHLYNLYHVLNHYNLFGGGYADQASGLIARLLDEI